MEKVGTIISTVLYALAVAIGILGAGLNSVDRD